MKTNMVTIPKKLYLRLYNNSEKLELLENGGVDNWEWYSESLYPDDDDGYLEAKDCNSKGEITLFIDEEDNEIYPEKDDED